MRSLRSVVLLGVLAFAILILLLPESVPFASAESIFLPDQNNANLFNFEGVRLAAQDSTVQGAINMWRYDHGVKHYWLTGATFNHFSAQWFASNFSFNASHPHLDCLGREQAKRLSDNRVKGGVEIDYWEQNNDPADSGKSLSRAISWWENHAAKAQNPHYKVLMRDDLRYQGAGRIRTNKACDGTVLKGMWDVYVVVLSTSVE